MVFLRTVTQEQPIRDLWRTALKPLRLETSLHTFSAAGDTLRKETFVSTSSSMAWIHLASILKDPTIHLPMLLVVRGGKDGSHEVNYLIFL